MKKGGPKRDLPKGHFRGLKKKLNYYYLHSMKLISKTLPPSLFLFSFFFFSFLIIFILYACIKFPEKDADSH